MTLIWLVGPPGAGKSTFVRLNSEIPYLEFTDMLNPLTARWDLTQGVMQANARLIEIIRTVRQESIDKFPADLFVVAGSIEEEAIFPLHDDEEVWLIRPAKDRWEKQFSERPAKYGDNPQFKNFQFSEEMYTRFESWLDYEHVKLVEVPFIQERIGKLAEELD